LLGAYLIGSLAHAGFSRRYSDIDIALVTETGLSPPALDRITRACECGGPRAH
jgi:predicted nucleotidyltransferase